MYLFMTPTEVNQFYEGHVFLENNTNFLELHPSYKCVSQASYINILLPFQKLRLLNAQKQGEDRFRELRLDNSCGPFL